jgi:hypothetical protein
MGTKAHIQPTLLPLISSRWMVEKFTYLLLIYLTTALSKNHQHLTFEFKNSFVRLIPCIDHVH